ncbi:MAG: Gfo/Idh/MocA family oxidoreductase [Armatimonadetes bacterium]|nr:Gfo/Idh/MocA family oxidoreductase [Armatimonadota bacterium]
MRRVRFGVIGVGGMGVAHATLLQRMEETELVAVCSASEERTRHVAQQLGVHGFTDYRQLLRSGLVEAVLVATPHPLHAEVALYAFEQGVHVLCEKPFATTLEEGRTLLETARQHGVNIWGAPTVVTSPAFQCMARLLAEKAVGEVYVARAWYGHGGPSWGPWFYQKGGGSLFDLGVYNITTLTGLLGPAQSVVALMGTAIPERLVEGQRVQVEADDNAIVLMDHGTGVFSCVMTGFVYGPYHEERTVELVGTRGSINLLGWDWHPKGVEVWDEEREAWKIVCEDQQGYNWNQGGSYLARCLATGEKPLMTAEHAFHVLEVMLAAQQSAQTGQRIAIHSRFSAPWREGNA